MPFSDVINTVLPPQNGTPPHVTGNYGEVRSSGPHGGADFNYEGGQTGVNLTRPTINSPIEGTVTFVGGQYGTIKIRDADGNSHELLHTSSQNVQVGQKVYAGDPIGTMGGTGPNGADQYAQHVHYQMKDPYGVSMNPQEWWDSSPTPDPIDPPTTPTTITSTTTPTTGTSSSTPTTGTSSTTPTTGTSTTTPTTGTSTTTPTTGTSTTTPTTGTSTTTPTTGTSITTPTTGTSTTTPTTAPSAATPTSITSATTSTTVTSVTTATTSTNHDDQPTTVTTATTATTATSPTAPYRHTKTHHNADGTYLVEIDDGNWTCSQLFNARGDQVHFKSSPKIGNYYIEGSDDGYGNGFETNNGEETLIWTTHDGVRSMQGSLFGRFFDYDESSSSDHPSGLGSRSVSELEEMTEITRAEEQGGHYDFSV